MPASPPCPASPCLAATLCLLAACADPPRDEKPGGDGGGGGSLAADALSLSLLDDDAERVYVARTTRTAVDASATWDGAWLDGSLQYRTEVDGEVVCDATVALTGGAASTACDGCDYAFEVSGEVTEDAGTADCLLFGPLSLTSDTIWRDHRVAWWAEDEEPGEDGMIAPRPDVSRVGYLIDYADYGGATYGPYWWTLATAETPTRAFVREDDALAWWMDETVEALAPTWFRDCDGLSGRVREPPARVPADATGSVDCAGVRADRWTVSAEAGQTLFFAADTVAADTAADLALFVNAPDGCSVTFADDSFPCTFPPTEHTCPAVEVPATQAGVWSVVVWSYGDCTGDRADYALAVWSVEDG